MKKLIVIVLTIILIFVMSGCNKQLIDTTWNFNEAIVDLKNGEIVRGHLESWRDYENSDMIQVRIDGVTYLTHSANIIMIAK